MAGTVVLKGKPMMHRVLLTLLLLATPALAQKTGPSVQAAASPLALLARLPANLAGLQRGATTDYAREANDPRLGASVNYLSPRNVRGTVYLYDAGLTGIGGRDTPALVDAQLRNAVAEVRQVWGQRGIRVLSERQDSQTGLRCVLLELGGNDTPLADSAVCIGNRGPLFLKLRVTAPPGATGLLAAHLPGFAQGAVAALR